MKKLEIGKLIIPFSDARSFLFNYFRQRLGSIDLSVDLASIMGYDVVFYCHRDNNAALYRTQILHHFPKFVGAGSPKNSNVANRLNKPARPHE
ncbi:MAG: hypothetical protein HC942_01130 [Microcoleus sp. SU_5_6]|nr:hypothetical protein [Microcoleus sp. SU_5_6]